MTFIGRLGVAMTAARSAYSAAKSPAGRQPWNPPRGTANDAVGKAGLTIAARARDAVRNNAYAARIVDIWVAHAVGTGISSNFPQAQAGAWKTWSSGVHCDAQHALDWAGIQALAMRAVVESGEVLIRLVSVPPTMSNPVGLELLVLESDTLEWSRSGRNGDNRVIQGVEINAVNRPVAYWLRPELDGTSVSSTVTERVPADQIIHLYRRRRPGQVRDVSWLAPVLWQLRDLGSYEAALLRKAEIEACLAAIVHDEGDDGLTAAGGNLLKDARGQAVEGFEPGMILYRRGAGSVDLVNPTTGGSHIGYAKRTLEAAAVGAGLTYDQVSGDLTGANYSSLRAGKIEFRRLLEQVQYTMLVPGLCQRVAERFQINGALVGLWPGKMQAVAHVPPVMEMVDPVKDTRALIMQVRAGFVPPQDAVGQFGYVWRDMVQALKAAHADLDRDGIILDIDPRRTAGSGGAQDAAQNAAVELSAEAADATTTEEEEP